MLPKVLNCKNAMSFAGKTGTDVVFIGRGGKYGNPFIIGVDGDRNEVCDKYEKYAKEKFTKKEIQKDLKNKDLLCFCSPKRCHGDYLLKIANEE